MFKPKLRRKSSRSGLKEGANSGVGSGRMLGTRILRTVVLVAAVLVLLMILHAGVLYPRGQCLASVDMGDEPLKDDVFYWKQDTKQVDMYGFFSFLFFSCIGVWLILSREMFVMSKCPDAADAEATITTVMNSVGHKVNLNFTYIASYTSQPGRTNARYQNLSQGQELVCKHGPTECIGNRQQLWYDPVIVLRRWVVSKNIIHPRSSPSSPA